MRVLDKCFDWKQQDEAARDVLLLGGDIHCGVTSDIFDDKTDLTIKHITTSPITNHVTKFFPDRSGRINDRYRYEHTPLGQKDRNYAEIVINFEHGTEMFVNLTRVPTNMFKITDYISED